MSVKQELGVGVFFFFFFFSLPFFDCLFLYLTNVVFLVFFYFFFLLYEYLALTSFTCNRLNTIIILTTS